MTEIDPALLDWLEASLYGSTPAPDILERAPGLTPAQAYALQHALMKRRVAKGERVIGYKAAQTSRATQRAAGIPGPVVGPMFGSGYYLDGDAVSLKGMVRCTTEPEIGVLLKRDLAGPGCTPAEALRAIEGFMPAIEVVDNRLAAGKRSYPMSICSNKFSGGIVIGGVITPRKGIDLRLEGMVHSLNGEVKGSATGVEAMGNPLNVVAAIANAVAAQDESLKAGMVLITGTLDGNVPIAAGDHYLVQFTHLGTVGVRFTA